MIAKYFDIRRFWLLLKLELYKSRKGIGMLIIITFGMLFFVGLLLSLVIERHVLDFHHEEGFAFTLLAGGYIISSLAFNDSGNTLKRYNYLMLPVSTLERFLCMWLLTTLGWILIYTLIYTCYTWVANSIGQLIFSKVTFYSFNPFQDVTFTAIKVYFVTQGIFLIGAAHFRGYVFPKTLMVIFLIAGLCGLLIYFSMKDIFLADHYCEVKADGSVDCVLVDTFLAHQISDIIQWMFWWLLAPLTWVVSYLGLKEQEV